MDEVEQIELDYWVTIKDQQPVNGYIKADFFYPGDEGYDPAFPVQYEIECRNGWSHGWSVEYYPNGVVKQLWLMLGETPIILIDYDTDGHQIDWSGMTFGKSLKETIKEFNLLDNPDDYPKPQ